MINIIFLQQVQIFMLRFLMLLGVLLDLKVGQMIQGVFKKDIFSTPMINPYLSKESVNRNIGYGLPFGLESNMGL